MRMRTGEDEDEDGNAWARVPLAGRGSVAVEMLWEDMHGGTDAVSVAEHTYVLGVHEHGRFIVPQSIRS